MQERKRLLDGRLSFRKGMHHCMCACVRLCMRVCVCVCERVWAHYRTTAAVTSRSDSCVCANDFDRLPGTMYCPCMLQLHAYATTEPSIRTIAALV